MVTMKLRRIFTMFTFFGVLCAGLDVVSVSVKEGDSVTLHNNFTITNKYKIRWYFNNTQIALIDLSNRETCTDVQCNKDTETFRDRLKLDNQTGSLTITDTRSTDSGEYTLEIICIGCNIDKIYNVTVYRVSAVDKHEMKNKTDEESDTADPGLSTGIKAGICVTAVLLLVIIAVVGIYIHRRQARKNIQSGHRALNSGEQEPLLENLYHVENAEPLTAAKK